jgi:hypothetical protein
MPQWIRQKHEDERARITLWRRLLVLAAFVALSALLAGYGASQVPDFWRWPIGLGFAVGIGQFACPCFLRILRDDYMRIPKPDVLGPSRGVPPWLVGLFETFVFFVAVGTFFNERQALAGVFAAMGVWLAAKMLAGWNRDISVIVKDKPEREREQWLEERSRGAFAALLAGVLNLAIAGAGGNIAAGGIVASGGEAVIRPAVSYGAAVLDDISDSITRFRAEDEVNPSPTTP